MAIQNYCVACRTANPLEVFDKLRQEMVPLKQCQKCGATFTKDNRKFRVDVSVKGRRITRLTENLTLAREVETAVKTDLIRNEFDITHHQAPKKIPTLNDVWEKFLPWAEHKPALRTDRGFYRKHLQPRFGNNSLDNITSLDIERMKTELRKSVNARGKTYSPQTIKHLVVLLRRLYNLARKWNLYDGKNPVDGVQIPRVDNQKTEFLTDEELSRLHEVVDNWPFDNSAAFIKFALFTGLRRGELFKLTWDAVDFERGLVTLATPKGGKTMTIPVSDKAVEVLHGLDRVSAFVFPGKHGKQRTDFKGPWQRIRKAAGLPADFRFHGLRHHFASALVSNGVDLSVVSALLTHKDMGTTQRYAHLAPGVVKAAAQKSAELLPKQKATIIPFTGKE